MKKSRILQLIQVIIVVGIFLYVFHDINFVELYHTFLKVELSNLFYIVVFEILYFLSNAVAFWLLCRKKFGLSLAEGIGASMFAWLVDMLIPLAFIEGNLARILYLKTKRDWSSAVGYTLLFQFLTNVTFTVFILVTTIASLNFIYLYEQYFLFYITVILLLILTVVLLAFLIFDTNRVKNVTVRILRKFAGKYQFVDKVEKDVIVFLDSMKDSLQETDPKSLTLWLAVVFLFIQWISGIMTPYFSLQAVEITINPIFIAPGYSILTVFSLASIGLPFMVGSVDAALLTLYLLLGVPKEKALAATLIGRSVTIATSISIIYPIGIYYAKKVISVSNLNEIKQTLEKLLREYNINIPFVDIVSKNE
ncbi:MAG: hypothetical protein DRJ35_01360 [Thermoprotei archaeon]|nr:MAG: hypothetical protein DRJ35_01360 [Thermoprotei archaeon]